MLEQERQLDKAARIFLNIHGRNLDNYDVGGK